MASSSCVLLLVLASAHVMHYGVQAGMMDNIMGTFTGSQHKVHGDSVMGTSVLSDVLHKYFARHEKQGQKIPTWRPEVEAVLSLVENMKNLKDINATTQANVNELVGNIIQLLQDDVDKSITEQSGASSTLASQRAVVQDDIVTPAANLYDQLKQESGDVKTCHLNADTLNTEYSTVHQCALTVSDFDENNADSVCNCEVNSIFDFALTDIAKAVHWCDFSSDETAQSCINRLWQEVNVTRSELRNEHTEWTKQHDWCQANRTECARCSPLRNNIANQTGWCQGQHSGVFAGYVQLQTRQTAMCNAATALASDWATASNLQTSRAQEWSDLKFIICIFEKYRESGNFRQEDYNECSADGSYSLYTAVEYYAAAPVGELQEPTLNMNQVPPCVGDAQNAEETVTGLDGLLYMWNMDGCSSATSVKITTNNIFQPVNSELGTCSASSR